MAFRLEIKFSVSRRGEELAYIVRYFMTIVVRFFMTIVKFVYFHVTDDREILNHLRIRLNGAIIINFLAISGI